MCEAVIVGYILILLQRFNLCDISCYFDCRSVKVGCHEASVHEAGRNFQDTN